MSSESKPPPAIAFLIEALAEDHAAGSRRALAAGRRYRRAFWSLYLLSALAVLCAVMPLALGWDGGAAGMHPLAGAWAALEVALIAILGLTYLAGQRRDWQGQWLATRTEAELARYLPLVAPLVIPARAGAPGNWYARLYAQPSDAARENAIDRLCARFEPAVQALLGDAWSDPAFIGAYAGWATGLFEEQRRYHLRLAARSEALLRRLHSVKAILFLLTFAAALAHLALHWVWLSLVTIFFPALAAALHGALAQSEAFRLAAASRRVAGELGQAISAIGAHYRAGDAAGLRTSIAAGVALMLDEHRDWQMLVRPHHLPLG